MSDIRFPVLQGDYLGQKPPADKAELFGLGTISSVWGIHSTAVFSPDGNEVYWAPMISYPGEIYSRGGLLVMKRVDGRNPAKLGEETRRYGTPPGRPPAGPNPSLWTPTSTR